MRGSFTTIFPLTPTLSRNRPKAAPTFLLPPAGEGGPQGRKRPHGQMALPRIDAMNRALSSLPLIPPPGGGRGRRADAAFGRRFMGREETARLYMVAVCAP